MTDVIIAGLSNVIPTAIRAYTEPVDNPAIITSVIS
jgi:hypothetical protein